MWRLNPRARDGFRGIEVRGTVLLAAVSLGCALSAVGLWRGERWGRWLAIVVLAVQLAGDAVTVLTGADRRAAVGVPVALALLLYLSSRRVGAYFAPALRASGIVAGEGRPHGRRDGLD